MSARIVLAINDAGLAGQAAALAHEGDAFEVLDVVQEVDGIVRRLSRTMPDVLVLHDTRGVASALRLTVELGVALPEVAVVLILADLKAEHLRAAMQAGARDVVALPLSLEDLQVSVRTAAEWSRAMRDRVASEPEAATATGVSGRVIAVAGAKGGCGTTTLAIHLALAVGEFAPRTRICIVDLDLQTGDFRNFLDLPYRRSIADLVEVAQELSVRHLEETLYVHGSGMRVLLAPEEGELADDMTGAVASAVLGALRARHDLTIVDVGATASDATAAACELADDVLVVTTPDVLALRGAQRLTRLWTRLQVAGPAARIVLNRTSRRREVQPDLARQVVGAALCKTTIPANFPALEGAVNTGMPDRVEERKLRDAFVELAEEIGLLVHAPEEVPIDESSEGDSRGLVARLTGERGQSTVEAMGIMPVVGLIVLAIWQFGLVGYTYMLTAHAAREGARANAVGVGAVGIIREDVPKSWRDGMRCAISDTRVRVSIAVPAVLPGLETPLRISSQAGITNETKPVGAIDRNLKEPVKRKDNACRPDDKNDDHDRDDDEPDATLTVQTGGGNGR